MCPSEAIRSIEVGGVTTPPAGPGTTKSGFTSGISAPAWFRMKATGKQRLDAAGAAGEDGDGPGGSHRGEVAVPEPALGAGSGIRPADGHRWHRDPRWSAPTPGTPPGPWPASRRPSGTPSSTKAISLRPAQPLRGCCTRRPPGSGDPPSRHDAETDAADPVRQIGDLGKGIAIGIDDVVQKWVERCNHPPQCLPVDPILGRHTGGGLLHNFPTLTLPRLQTS